MAKTIISEGRTTSEAIEKGLKEIGLPKELCEIKVIDENKKSFFDILAPRVVKVELKLKEDSKKVVKEKKEIVLTIEEQEKAAKNIENFMKDFVKELPEDTKYSVEKNTSGLNVSITSEKLGFLIGYRGETLYALQSILTAIAGKGVEQRVRVILDIEGYKEKREKTLEELAEKVAKTVIRTKKPIKLEPMKAYERKIIHSKLQGNSRVETTSVGEEPHRRIIVSLKK